MEFFNKMFTRDEKTIRLQKEIKSLQIRKESVVSVIQSEIFDLEREKKELFCEAGMTAYEKWNKEQETTNLIMFWEKVQEIEKKLVEQQKRKMDMESRYDEEILLLQHDLNSGNRSMGKECCSKCGAETSNGDTFCEQCGNKLQ